jgi:hypothetical protein
MKLAELTLSAIPEVSPHQAGASAPARAVADLHRAAPASGLTMPVRKLGFDHDRHQAQWAVHFDPFVALHDLDRSYG